MRRSQHASARDAGGVPVPLFTGDVAAVNPVATKLSAYGAIVKAQYSVRASLRGSDWVSTGGLPPRSA
jgi:hypothetical protein